MTGEAAERDRDVGDETPKSRPVRADVQRNLDALLKAAMAVFAASGVDAPVREIADAAKVGVGTVYRHFPQRSDLVSAVFRHEVDACADAAAVMAATHGPAEALGQWLQRYVDFLAAKRGLVEAAIAAGEVRADIEPSDLLSAVASLSLQTRDQDPALARRMVALLVDGLRYGVKSTA